MDQLRDLPAALIITGECDVLRDEGEAYARRLVEADVAVTATRYPGTIDDFVMLNALSRNARRPRRARAGHPGASPSPAGSNHSRMTLGDDIPPPKKNALLFTRTSILLESWGPSWAAIARPPKFGEL